MSAWLVAVGYNGRDEPAGRTRDTTRGCWMGQRSVEEMLEAVRRQEALIRQRKVKLQARLTAQQKQRQLRQQLLLGSWLMPQLATDAGLRERVRTELLPQLPERDRALLGPLLDEQAVTPAPGQASGAAEGSLL